MVWMVVGDFQCWEDGLKRLNYCNCLSLRWAFQGKKNGRRRFDFRSIHSELKPPSSKTTQAVRFLPTWMAKGWLGKNKGGEVESHRQGLI